MLAVNPNPKLNCAGQGCPERDGCRRYEIRIAEGHLEVGGVRVQQFGWASFDLEREAFGGCFSRIRVHELKNKKFGAA